MRVCVCMCVCVCVSQDRHVLSFFSVTLSLSLSFSHSLPSCSDWHVKAPSGLSARSRAQSYSSTLTIGCLPLIWRTRDKLSFHRSRREVCLQLFLQLHGAFNSANVLPRYLFSSSPLLEIQLFKQSTIHFDVHINFFHFDSWTWF